MKTLIMDCFGLSPFRTELLRSYFAGRGDEVLAVTSDWDHYKKQRRTSVPPGTVCLPALSYRRNISLRRAASHYFFARDAFAYAEKVHADAVYTHVPPNSMAYFAALYKKRHPAARLYLSLIDMWPETMPGLAARNSFPFTLWRRLRDSAFPAADIIVCECQLYIDRLRGVPGIEKAQRLYLAVQDPGFFSAGVPRSETLNLCYLGSINNIIDIQLIAQLTAALSRCRPVQLHIIGDGENRQKLLDAARSAGAAVHFYGLTFDAELKRRVFAQCHFALNVMKPQVCVGLTSKSLDYFAAGLPLLNTIAGDTAGWVNRFGAGFNITDAAETAARVLALSPEAMGKMRAASRGIYDRYLSVPAYTARLHKIFDADTKNPAR